MFYRVLGCPIHSDGAKIDAFIEATHPVTLGINDDMLVPNIEQALLDTLLHFLTGYPGHLV